MPQIVWEKHENLMANWFQVHLEICPQLDSILLADIGWLLSKGFAGMRQRCLDLNIKYSALLMTVCLLLTCSFLYPFYCLGWQHSILLREIHCLQIFWHAKELTYTISFKPKHTASKLLNSADIPKTELSHTEAKESDKEIVKICQNLVLKERNPI